MKYRVIMALLLIACVSSASIAVYYKRLSESFQKQWTSAQGEAERQAKIAKDAASAVLPASVPESEATPPVTAPAHDDSAALKEQVQNLELSMQAKDQQIALLLQNATNNAQDQARPWQNRTNWLEQLKTQNPTQYEAIVKSREESRQRVRKSFAEKADHFLKQDTSKLSDQEKESYNQMLGLLDQTWKLSEQLRTDLPREQRWPIMQNMRDNMDTLQPLLDSERDRELYATAQQLGYNDTDAAAYVKYMNDIIASTSMRSMFEGMRGGGFFGGPGRGPQDGRNNRPPQP